MRRRWARCRQVCLSTDALLSDKSLVHSGITSRSKTSAARPIMGPRELISIVYRTQNHTELLQTFRIWSSQKPSWFVLNTRSPLGGEYEGEVPKI